MTLQSAATTVEELVTSANIEVIPLRGADEKALAIPSESTITITCSPKFGLERTLEHVIRARESGHRVVPHLAARMVEDEAQLQRFLGILSSVGVDDLYVIGGDGADPVGKYSEALHILEAIQDLDHDLQRIGVGCYPEGHPNIADDALVDALQRKQPYADYMVSQLCFDAGTFIGWLRTMRGGGGSLRVRGGGGGALLRRAAHDAGARSPPAGARRCRRPAADTQAHRTVPEDRSGIVGEIPHQTTRIRWQPLARTVVYARGAYLPNCQRNRIRRTRHRRTASVLVQSNRPHRRMAAPNLRGAL